MSESSELVNRQPEESPDPPTQSPATTPEPSADGQPDPQANGQPVPQANGQPVPGSNGEHPTGSNGELHPEDPAYPWPPGVVPVKIKHYLGDGTPEWWYAYSKGVNDPKWIGIDFVHPPSAVRMRGANVKRENVFLLDGSPLPPYQEPRKEKKKKKKKKKEEGEGEGEGKPDPAEILAGLTDHLPLVRSKDARRYAMVPRGPCLDLVEIKSGDFKDWLMLAYREEAGTVPPAEAINAFIAMTEARCHDARVHDVYSRIGQDDAGYIYLNLNDDARQVVKIGPCGWEVITDPPCLFRRVPTMLPLPFPSASGKPADVSEFFNLGGDDRSLAYVALVHMLLPGNPQVGILINGEDGSAKSTMTRFFKSCIDPCEPALKGVPKDGRDIAVSTRHHHVFAYDNASYLSRGTADILCCLMTGYGFETRKLYTDEDQVRFSGRYPVVLNGINDFDQYADLNGRCIRLHCLHIEEEEVIDDNMYWKNFRQMHPKILGALLNSLVKALGELPELYGLKTPRMRSYAMLGEAIGVELGWESGAFLEAYKANLDSATETIIDESVIIPPIREWIRYPGNDGRLLSSGELLKEISYPPHSDSKKWPGSPQKLGNMIRRESRALRKIGFEVDFRGQKEGHDNTYKLSITKIKESIHDTRTLADTCGHLEDT
jgi:hypothetical protein